MINNPEFQRYLWTRFSRGRVFSLVMVLGLFGLLIYMMPGAWQEDAIVPFHTIAYLSIALWGVYNASNVFGREIANKTWDFQKMSPMSSWALLLGKLFGVTSFAWFVGGIAYAVVFIACLTTPDFNKFNVLIHHSFLFVLAGLLGQAAAILMSLLWRHHEKMKQGGVVALITGLVVMAAVVAFSENVYGGIDELGTVTPSLETTLWYDFALNVIWLGYMNIAFAAFWIFVGAHQILRERLQYNDPPFVWLGFVVSFSLYTAGFYVQSDFGIATYAYFTSLLLTYIVMVIESDRITPYHSWMYHVRAKNYKKAIEKTPKWMASASVVILAYLCASIFSSSLETTIIPVFLAAFTLFAMRDGLVLHALRLGEKSKGHSFAIWVYYLLAYIILPWLLMSFLGLESAVEHLSPFDILETAHKSGVSSLAIFFPLPIKSALWILAPVTLEVLLAGLFLLKRLRTMQA